MTPTGFAQTGNVTFVQANKNSRASDLKAKASLNHKGGDTE